MTNWDETNRPNKAKVRRFAVENYTPRQHAILFLPSRELRDVKLALEEGSISTSQHIIFVEKTQEDANIIHTELRARGFTSIYSHIGQLCDLPLDRALKGKKLGYAFFDTCGQLTVDIATWLACIPKECIAENADFHFTFAIPRDSVISVWPQIAYDHMLDGVNCNLPFSPLSDNNHNPETLYENLQLYYVILKNSLGNFTTKRRRSLPYRDTRTWMFYYHIQLNHKSMHSRFRKLFAAVKEYNDSTIRADARTSFSPDCNKDPIMVEAGKKAWATRRQNALKEKL